MKTKYNLSFAQAVTALEEGKTIKSRYGRIFFQLGPILFSRECHGKPICQHRITNTDVVQKYKIHKGSIIKRIIYSRYVLLICALVFILLAGCSAQKQQHILSTYKTGSIVT